MAAYRDNTVKEIANSEAGQIGINACESKIAEIIKFTKDKTNWFCLYDGKYIRRYRGETFKRDKVISMRRYLDELFNPEAVKKVIERFDARDFKYCDIMSQALFQAQLKLIKQK